MRSISEIDTTKPLTISGLETFHCPDAEQLALKLKMPELASTTRTVEGELVLSPHNGRVLLDWVSHNCRSLFEQDLQSYTQDNHGLSLLSTSIGIATLLEVFSDASDSEPFIQLVSLLTRLDDAGTDQICIDGYCAE
ncbi:hypothetical protein LH464_22150 [Neorhizobium sp. T786]|uniref:hypothetical protein n=1 Tax=Pseudorhizobium xiangyangii TaxID=2883104 RepID=UPI001CFFF7A2|nr:hypothetical protein [Neorhizobium xiangyangii]MCB5205174.1 hypothetical protein [Neorhizobium xiangyangii]